MIKNYYTIKKAKRCFLKQVNEDPPVVKSDIPMHTTHNLHLIIKQTEKTAQKDNRLLELASRNSEYKVIINDYPFPVGFWVSVFHSKDEESNYEEFPVNLCPIR